MIHTFSLVGGGQVDINLESVLDFEYRVNNPDGTIRVKYPGSPEFHVVDIPLQLTTADRETIEIYSFVVPWETDANGTERCTEAFAQQWETIQARSLKYFMGFAILEIIDKFPTSKRDPKWEDYGEGIEYVVHLKQTDLGAIVIGQDADGEDIYNSDSITPLAVTFKSPDFESLMDSTTVGNMANFPWFGPPETNPFNGTRRIVTRWCEIGEA